LTGGGQPHDLGLIAGRKVLECVRKGMNCIHIIEGDSLEVGSDVEVQLDWDRRWDHMQQVRVVVWKVSSGDDQSGSIANKSSNGFVDLSPRRYKYDSTLDNICSQL
jgi:hypothetical protein